MLSPVSISPILGCQILEKNVLDHNASIYLKDYAIFNYLILQDIYIKGGTVTEIRFPRLSSFAGSPEGINRLASSNLLKLFALPNRKYKFRIA